MSERAKEQRKNECERLDILKSKHEDLIPTVHKTQVMVDLYWKCYAYGDELKPHIEFLEGIMLSSTREIAPSCVENVYELIERQEKSLNQLETRRAVVKDLIDKGNEILRNPDKPKFLEGHVQRIEEGWDDTKDKALARLNLLNETKAAWEGYAEGNIKIAEEFEKCEAETKKVKKKYNLEAAVDNLAKRQTIFRNIKLAIDDMWKKLNSDMEIITLMSPDDKKQALQKELDLVKEKLPLVITFEDKVKKLEEFSDQLKSFDVSLSALDSWMKAATTELEDIKKISDQLLPEDRVSRAMELYEDITAKTDIIQHNINMEKELFPQGIFSIIFLKVFKIYKSHSF